MNENFQVGSPLFFRDHERSEFRHNGFKHDPRVTDLAFFYLGVSSMVYEDLKITHFAHNDTSLLHKSPICPILKPGSWLHSKHLKISFSTNVLHDIDCVKAS